MTPRNVSVVEIQRICAKRSRCQQLIGKRSSTICFTARRREQTVKREKGLSSFVMRSDGRNVRVLLQQGEPIWTSKIMVHYNDNNIKGTNKDKRYTALLNCAVTNCEFTSRGILYTVGKSQSSICNKTRKGYA